MNMPATRAGVSWPVRAAVTLMVLGGISIVASVLVAYLLADHSSSDSSPSSLAAIGLGECGLLAAVLGMAGLGGIALVRLWRERRRASRGG
jgi:hypothetical protein